MGRDPTPRPGARPEAGGAEVPPPSLSPPPIGRRTVAPRPSRLRARQLRRREFVEQWFASFVTPEVQRENVPEAAPEVGAQARARDVGRENDVRECPEGMLRRHGIPVVRIERGPGDPSFLQRADERFLADDRTPRRVQHEGPRGQRPQLRLADPSLGLRGERHGHDEKIQPGEKRLLLASAEDAVGERALWVSRPRYLVDETRRPDALPGQHVDRESKVPRQTCRLATDPAVTPDPDGQAADLALEDGAAVPDPRVLVPDHLSEIAREVDHHRHVPFRDRHVEAAAAIRRPDAPGRERVPEELRIPRRGDLDPAQRRHVRQVGRRVRAEERLHIAESFRREFALDLGWRHHHVEVVAPALPETVQHRRFHRHVDQHLHGGHQSRRILPGTLLNSPEPGLKG